MKLNPAQSEVVAAVSAARKATYAQAIANGGNGRTVTALVKGGVLAEVAPSGKVKEVTYTLTDSAKAQLKEKAALAKKAAKVAAKTQA